MSVRGIHHIALKCDGIEEYEKTVKFYREVLGLQLVREWGEGENAACMLDTGAGMMEIFAKAEDLTTVGAVRHFAFAVESTDRMIAAVRRAGYTVTVEPKDIVIPSLPPYPARIGFCIGPLGEEVEFFEEK